jgi:hypothetical protein
MGIPVINPGFNLRMSCIHLAENQISAHYQSLVIASDNMANFELGMDGITEVTTLTLTCLAIQAPHVMQIIKR